MYQFEIETVTTDSELALIKAIKTIFPKIKHFNCYFHYKQDLIRRFKKEGLYKRKQNNQITNESQKVLKILGLLPLQYKGDINFINNKLEEIVQNYPNFKNIIENYFKNYKLEFFVNGDYNYNELPADCRSNSYLENYNLYMKQNLGKKYKLQWDVFLNFLKNESERIRNKLTKKTETNVFKKLKKLNLELKNILKSNITKKLK